MKIIDEFLAGWREGRALREAQRKEALLVTKCHKGHFYNAKHESGLCPHLNVHQQAAETLRGLKNRNLPLPAERKIH